MTALSHSSLISDEWTVREREKREKKSQNENNSKIFLKSNEMRNKSKNFSKWGTLGNGSQIDALKLSQSHLYIFLYYYILYIVLIKLYIYLGQRGTSWAYYFQIQSSSHHKMTIPKKFSQALPACPAMIKTVSHAPMFSDGATVYLKLFPLSHFTLCEPNILRTKTGQIL